MNINQFNQIPENKVEHIPLPADAATKVGEDFAKYYYEFMDNQRSDILSRYRPWTSVIWNGKKVADIKNLLQQLPPSKHKLSTVDCQPSRKNFTNLLVTATGTVEYSGDPNTRRFFTQNFVLVPEKVTQGEETITGCHIASDIFRHMAHVSQKSFGSRPKPQTH